jgi:phosphoglucosamine mutase
VSLRFGTDGIRGVAGTELTPELVVALGRVAGRLLVEPTDPQGWGDGGGPGPDRPVRGPARFLIGRDTRRSGPMLFGALAAGLAAEGVDVVDLGVMPTPGVAALSARDNCPAAVLSASHNPFPDNGIKLLSAGGRKLPAATEAALEEALAAELVGRDASHPSRGAPSGASLGAVGHDPDALSWYRRHLVGALEGRRLDGLRVAIDCANGAATVTALEVVAEAGAQVVGVIGDRPDGTNINAGCGSTDPSALVRLVRASRADVGLAFDGDADRVIAVDADATVVDGDQLLAIFALDLHRRGRLAGDTVVVTVMTNLGFHQAMLESGIAVHQTPVGDRSVLEALEDHGWSLGGEQSGHLIFRDLATTGDGVLSGLLLLDVVARSFLPLASLAESAMVRLPQVLRSVAVVDRDGLADAPAVWTEVRRAEAELGEGGRVLLRGSGTERVVRVMVEATTEAQAATIAQRLCDVVVEVLGSS